MLLLLALKKSLLKLSIHILCLTRMGQGKKCIIVVRHPEPNGERQGIRLLNKQISISNMELPYSQSSQVSLFLYQVRVEDRQLSQPCCLGWFRADPSYCQGAGTNPSSPHPAVNNWGKLVWMWTRRVLGCFTPCWGPWLPQIQALSRVLPQIFRDCPT